jgi:fructosamine-3-kinase
MPSWETDISWDVLRRIVHDWIGNSAELVEVKPLVGGCINTTLRLTTADGNCGVLKITPHRVNRAYEQEAYQLNILRQSGLPAPEVYACQIGSLDQPFSYLLMEFIEGVDFAQARTQCNQEQFDQLQMHLAELVLTMHEQIASHYGRVSAEDTPQHDCWPTFFKEIYDPIWHGVEKLAFMPAKCRKKNAKIHSRLDSLLAHEDHPRLVHWDIWSTNLLARPDEHGRWWVSAVLDPICKFAHSEAEVAYMELFHTITPAFLRAYQQTRPLDGEYHRLRKWIYQLYPLINHVHLFGREYIPPLEQTLHQLKQVA